ncbi:MAG: hypothetical protein ACRD1K_09415 [Acidimicrobiales bacterium]
MNAVDRTRKPVGIDPATCSAIGWGVAVAGFIAADAADAAWGWDGVASLIFGVASMVLVASGALLVLTQVRIGKLSGRPGAVATIGTGVSALGALLSFVAWAIVVWTTVLGVGTLLFGVPLLRRGLLPRPWGQAVTFALPAASVMAWAGAVVFDAGAEDASPVVSAVSDGLVAAAVVVLAVGLAGLGRWMRTDPQ